MNAYRSEIDRMAADREAACNAYIEDYASLGDGEHAKRLRQLMRWAWIAGYKNGAEAVLAKVQEAPWR